MVNPIHNSYFSWSQKKILLKFLSSLLFIVVNIILYVIVIGTILTSIGCDVRVCSQVQQFATKTTTTTIITAAPAIKKRHYKLTQSLIRQHSSWTSSPHKSVCICFIHIFFKKYIFIYCCFLDFLIPISVWYSLIFSLTSKLQSANFVSIDFCRGFFFEKFSYLYCVCVCLFFSKQIYPCSNSSTV